MTSMNLYAGWPRRRLAPKTALLAGLLVMTVLLSLGFRPQRLFVAPAQAPNDVIASGMGASASQALPILDSARFGAVSPFAAAAVAAALVLRRHMIGSAQPQGQRRSLRRAITGHRDEMKLVDKYIPERGDSPFFQGAYPGRYKFGGLFWPGVHGYGIEGGIPLRPKPSKARACLGIIEREEAMGIFYPSDFYGTATLSSPFEIADVKEVASYTIKADDRSMVTPAEAPKYCGIPCPIRFEKEVTPKRFAEDDEGYQAVIGKWCNLQETVKTVSQKCNFSLDKDFIADRGALSYLVSFLYGHMKDHMLKIDQFENPIDIVRISKVPDSKALLLEHVMDTKTLISEIGAPPGSWSKKNVYNTNGGYHTAFIRSAIGQTDVRKFDVRWNNIVAGTSAGPLDKHFRLVEFELGGLSFMSKAEMHCTKEGKNVELHSKSFHWKADLRAADTYAAMLFGGVEASIFGWHSRGQLKHYTEFTVEKILEREPQLQEVCAKYFHRLVELLKQVKEAVDKADDDGPWVLQWQKGALVLGKWELKEEVIVESDDTKEGVKSKVTADGTVEVSV